MLDWSRALGLILCGSLLLAHDATAAYPERPIRYVIPSAAGGGPDTAARVVMAELGKQLGQQIVVDNRPGASGMIGTELIAKATPDGYTIGHGNIATLGINRSVLRKLPYDLDRDIRPVVQMYFTPNLLGSRRRCRLSR
jgi:tripartite-type tricarboxylate transporter receptor subunit TctC